MVARPITNGVQNFGHHAAHVPHGGGIQRTHFSGSGSGYSSHHSHDYDGHGHDHYGGGGGKKRSIALSALTLLAFLFFLNILQNCIEDQMYYTTTTTTAAPAVIVMQRLHQLKENHNRQTLESQLAIDDEDSSAENRDIPQPKINENEYKKIDNIQPINGVASNRVKLNNKNRKV